MSDPGRDDLLTVLLVEDDPADARLIGEMVRAAGSIRLARVDSLAPALDRLRRDRFDAVLLDLRLPDADGLEALEAVRAAAPELPVLVCSGLVDVELARDAMRLGAQDFLLKRYVDEEMFVRAIHYAVERRRSSGALHRLRDEATGLATGVLFDDRLEQALGRARRDRCSLAVLRLSVGRPGETGHPGRLPDAVPREVAARLGSCVRASDAVARDGDGEFLVLLAELARPEHAAAVAEKLFAAVDRPFAVGLQELALAIHGGIALFPNDGESAADLLRHAGEALEQARNCEPGGYRFRVPALNAQVLDRQELGLALRDGLERGEFELTYQPLVDLHSGRVRALEALLRWEHPGGCMLPKLFLPVAEAAGLGGRIGEWVLRQACSRAAAWQQGEHAGVGVTVNLSASQVFAGELPETVSRVLEETGLDPALLELELGEEELAGNGERAVFGLSRVHALGVSVSLDDFAARALPLPQLSHLPVDGVKLDRSLLRDATGDPGAAAVMRGLVELIHGLGRRVTAQGVETREQLDIARRSRCDGVQGYLVGRPGPAGAVSSLLATARS